MASSFSFLRAVAGVACSALLCCPAQAVAAGNPVEASSVPVLSSLEAEAWDFTVARNPSLQLREALPEVRLRTVNRSQLEHDRSWAQERLALLRQVEVEALDARDRLRWHYLENWFEDTGEAVDRYRFAFPVTPYQTGFSTIAYRDLALSLPLQAASDCAAYLTYLEDFAAHLAGVRGRLAEQAAAGIRVPKPALQGVRGVWHRLLDGAGLLIPGRDRTQCLAGDQQDGLVADAFREAASSVVTERLEPAYRAVLADLGPDYEAAAPARVGLWQYPGGPEHYHELVRRYTGSDESPAALHRRGLALMTELEAGMAAIRRSLGEDDREAFHRFLQTDARFRADSVEEVEDTYRRHLAAIEPLISRHFRLVPESPYAVKRADPEVEAGMTYGYYQAPSASDPRGYYRYNGSGLQERSLYWARPLIYHELIPGHHFQIALQQENDDLPKVRRLGGGLRLTAFTEGWAEYAAWLGFEMSLYDDPYIRYGRLAMELFAVARLVVDTGMHSERWTLERARDYLREHTLASEGEITSETLRYSTDIPGQALAYALGALKLRELRAEAEAALGERFDLRAFHAAVLEPGALPLPVLEAHIGDWIRAQRDGGLPPAGSASAEL
ncbi:DUF885 domain-containing protein [Pseudohaliea sp.]|uniref:DUF885 domain-containing protein n=1 Tax=Pseudohaliea sp. TaxID=2740289 RepID=UPI0032EEFD7C